MLFKLKFFTNKTFIYAISTEKNKNMPYIEEYEYRDVLGAEQQGSSVTVHLFARPYKNLKKKVKSCCCCCNNKDPNARELSKFSFVCQSERDAVFWVNRFTQVAAQDGDVLLETPAKK